MTLNNFNFDVNSGWTGKGLKFDGVDDWASLGSILNGNQNFTIEVNFKDTRQVNAPIIVSDLSYGVASMTGNLLRYVQWGSDIDVNVNIQDTLNVASMSRNRNTIRLYYNGVDVGGGSALKSIVKPIELGRLSTKFTNMTMYSVKVYSDYLTPEEIKQNYEYELSIDRNVAVAYPLLKEEKSYGIGLSNQLTEEQLKTFRLSNVKTKFVAGLRYCKGLKVEEYTYTEILKVMETEEWRSLEEAI
ncbi:hypothetical protein [Cetobacterium sp.]|uniref:hypothetical protein n=1 Tax=Cetobacterium sp. TaxID=2071632 RepID=UPI003F31F2D9